MTTHEPHRPEADGPPTRAVFVHPRDCETEHWGEADAPTVRWWTLLSADRTASSAMTVGLAEIPVGAPAPARGHTHAPAEVYVILEGTGTVTVDGDTHAVEPGTTVYIPGNAEHFAANTGNTPLRLLYTFAVDSFSDVVYEFPGTDD